MNRIQSVIGGGMRSVTTSVKEGQQYYPLPPDVKEIEGYELSQDCDFEDPSIIVCPNCKRPVGILLANVPKENIPAGITVKYVSV